MSPSSVFPGFHTGRSHHPSPSSEWNPRGLFNIVVKEECKEEDEEYGMIEELSEGHNHRCIQSWEPTRSMSPSSVFLGFHTGRSHHSSPSPEWKPLRL
ncbi:unnamed protein product [Staurois parvus]|uniref:Uncharacterized protein n=1 Tax=Staurois parvus TaxID=386267 RepID=A0ABN9DMU1_9NEOB|nr:unnamed protein product [Staurois parvus]